MSKGITASGKMSVGREAAKYEWEKEFVKEEEE